MQHYWNLDFMRDRQEKTAFGISDAWSGVQNAIRRGFDAAGRLARSLPFSPFHTEPKPAQPPPLRIEVPADQIRQSVNKLGQSVFGFAQDLAQRDPEALKKLINRFDSSPAAAPPQENPPQWRAPNVDNSPEHIRQSVNKLGQSVFGFAQDLAQRDPEALKKLMNRFGSSPDAPPWDDVAYELWQIGRMIDQGKDERLIRERLARLREAQSRAFPKKQQ